MTFTMQDLESYKSRYDKRCGDLNDFEKEVYNSLFSALSRYVYSDDFDQLLKELIIIKNSNPDFFEHLLGILCNESIWKIIKGYSQSYNLEEINYLLMRCYINKNLIKNILSKLDIKNILFELSDIDIVDNPYIEKLMSLILEGIKSQNIEPTKWVNLVDIGIAFFISHYHTTLTRIIRQKKLELLAKFIDTFDYAHWPEDSVEFILHDYVTALDFSVGHSHSSIANSLLKINLIREHILQTRSAHTEIWRCAKDQKDQEQRNAFYSGRILTKLLIQNTDAEFVESYPHIAKKIANYYSNDNEVRRVFNQGYEIQTTIMKNK